MSKRVVGLWLRAALAVALIVSSSYAGQAVGSCETKDDDAYSAAIRKATTETYFSTELVDHLPWSSCVPAPDTYLGHIIGAPDVLDHVEQINGYMRCWPAAVRACGYSPWAPARKGGR